MEDSSCEVEAMIAGEDAMAQSFESIMRKPLLLMRRESDGVPY